MIPVLLDPERLWAIAEWRVLVRVVAGYKCERCPAPFRPGPGQFIAHHRDRNRENNRLSNGELLCHACHTAEHRAELSSIRRRPRGPFTEAHRERLSEGAHRMWANRRAA